jgi:hypothetical protein
MRKEIYYTYLGENGTITTPVFLEGIYSIKKYRLIADKNKKLTKNNKSFVYSVTVSPSDLDLWYEVDDE